MSNVPLFIVLVKNNLTIQSQCRLPSLRHTASLPRLHPQPPIPSRKWATLLTFPFPLFTGLFPPTKIPHPVRHTLACGFSFLRFGETCLCLETVKSPSRKEAYSIGCQLIRTRQGKWRHAQCTSCYIYLCLGEIKVIPGTQLKIQSCAFRWPTSPTPNSTRVNSPECRRRV